MGGVWNRGKLHQSAEVENKLVQVKVKYNEEMNEEQMSSKTH